ncbi:MAG: tRNA pseudouridine(55) synthase TruB [Clostridiales bacterium]|nr:tRNA pseudouridine(55) synthase TruB [Clostridiales bacterium]
MNGIVIIDKPQGMTSHDVVSFLRRETGVKRIGHTGTLDPMATGVLPVFIGKATRLIEYAGVPGSHEAKQYLCDIKFGLETDTQDIWGETLSNNGDLPNTREIERVLKGFEGQGSQRPPMYSAVKVGGRKLYDYARKGDEVDASLIRERSVYIKQIIVKEINEALGEAVFEVICSKGVYIRTLCADAGRLLGCGAVMSGLRRLKSDGFSIDDAVALDGTGSEGARAKHLLPMDQALGWMRRIDLSESGSQSFTSGRLAASAEPFEAEADDDNGCGRLVRVYGPGGFLGVGRISSGETRGSATVKPEKVLV